MAFNGSNKQVIKNILFNGLNFLVSIINGLLITPLILTKLGKEPFVIIQLTISISMYATLFANSLNESLSLILVLKKRHSKNNIYSSATFIYLLLILIFLPLIFCVVYYSEIIFSISETYIYSSKVLLALNLISFIIIILTNYLTTPIYVNNRVDICQQIITTRNIIRTILIVISIYWVSNSLVSIGFSYLFSALALFVVAFFVFRKALPDVIIGYKYVTKELIKSLVHLGSWSLVFQLGILIFSYGDVIIASILLDNDSTADFTALIQWRVLVYSLTGLLLQVFHPLFLKLITDSETEKIKKLFLKGIRYLGVISTICCAIIFVYSKTILLYWLGEEYLYLENMLKLIIFSWSINCAFTLYKSIYLIYNKIKLISIISIAFAIAHVVISYILIVVFNFGIYALILSSVLMLLIRNIFVYPYFSSSFAEIKMKEVLKELLKLVFVFGTVVVLYKILNHNNYKIFYFMGAFSKDVIICDVTLFSFYFTILNKEEKLMIKTKIKKNGF